ncbi:ATP-binding region ATPase domain protein [Sulfurospirillum deleyianum DSM 6946]|uniref:histidine kinase n=1 Tax=Sulfurospirillum deleyianum (strain ATCC 51133 / DSM 6946 / 5175) TaxID=525898 RepID=D1B052_SULD5|nr:ATP-binding region ATPase domain protein [Sulfurospirillum deleyianum DSM 6946]
MIDETLLNSLSAKEKELFKQGLEDLINQTYVIEDEYKKLNESYTALQDFIRQIIEVQPNALWVLDEKGDIFLQNSEAKKLPMLLSQFPLQEMTKEIEFEGCFYLLKSVKQGDKRIITATDITEGKRHERLVSMGQVAAHLSHEIRNPIGSVSLLASTLLKKVDPSIKPIVTEIKKSIWRVERIIKATLLFTKNVQINPSLFYMDRFIKECEHAISHYSYTKEIHFHFTIPHQEMKGDFELLNLVLQNFIFNAIDAIEESEREEGNVSIAFVEDPLFIILHVKDDGKAIENKNILFQPFKTTKTKGNGLGLALSLQIIQAHGGRIDLLENPKGFQIQIPRL